MNKRIAILMGSLTILTSLGIAKADDMKMDETKPKMTSEQPKTTKKMKKAKKQAMYRCDMDGYQSDKPGKCPKCGMNLEPVKK
jgi:rubrerythrin